MKKKRTLAEFISTTRENIGLSQIGLAKKAIIDLSVLENIESGQDLFLSTTTRQKLAKALKLDAKVIKELEKPYYNGIEVPVDYIEEIKLRIIEGQLTGNICPVCKSELICRVAEMYDLEDHLVRHPKARCSKCPFQIK
jgi:transcriptional regulator with XRE-family HTH domain